jgi:N-acetylmuramoyl-L-alanine amidase
MSGVLKSLLFLGLLAVSWGVLGFHSAAFAQIDVTPRLKPSLIATKAESERNTALIETSSVENPDSDNNDSIPFPRLAPHLTKKKRTKPVIYIDAGHGGRDPGAIGVNGTQEKKIVFKASSTLKAMLEKTGRYKVVLTRPNDSYLDHELRLRLAREGGADLFISVHADSAGNKNAQGASVYTLADRAKGRSKRLVSGSQNWIMDVDLSKQSDPVGDILVDLAQRKTESQSEQFADILVNELAKSTKLVGNSHRRAGYFVLLAPDVPAVLLELGFLSNATDEKLLNKASHREKIMRSVVRSIDLYFAQNK